MKKQLRKGSMKYLEGKTKVKIEHIINKTGLVLVDIKGRYVTVRSSNLRDKMKK